MASRKRPFRQNQAGSGNQDERDTDDNQTITIDGKNKKVTLSLTGRGVVLVYAISFVILILAIGYAAVQLATAWRLVLTPFGPTVGLSIWGFIAFISAYLSR